ncbi:hypothetical protein KKG31_05000 [Patescibacteria group bacterium]|nr:hypothetical protein [Patescibacteria group bacterium]
MDRNDMERLITTTKYDENTKESKPVDQSDRTIIAHVNNVDISNYANDMPTLKQKLEDAYP